MVSTYSTITTREIENIRRILYGKVFNNLRKHNMLLPHEDIEEITSELLTWVLEKLSTTNTIQTQTTQTIPFISDKLISMFVSSYTKHKFYEIPVTSFISDDEQSDDIVEHLMYITNNVDEINIDDTDTEDEEQNQYKELDDFEIMQYVDELMKKLDERRNNNGSNNDSKFVVSKKLIRKYLYMLLKHGTDDAYRYKDTLTTGKRYRLEKNLELLSTLV